MEEHKPTGLYAIFFNMQPVDGTCLFVSLQLLIIDTLHCYSILVTLAIGVITGSSLTEREGPKNNLKKASELS